MHIVNKNKLSNKQTVCVIKGLHQISWQNSNHNRFTCYVGIISAFWGVSWNISSYLVNFFTMAYYVIAVTPLTTTAVANFLSSVRDDDENNDMLLLTEAISNESSEKDNRSYGNNNKIKL